MIRGAVSEYRYHLIKEYRNVKSFQRRMTTVIIVMAVLYLAWRFYENHLIVSNYLYEPPVRPAYQPLILIGFLGFIGLIMYEMHTVCIQVFREGIYVNTGYAIRLVRRNAYVHTGFMPWGELNAIVRTPYQMMGMAIIGKEPLDEIILPDAFKKHFDEIQRLIYENKPSGSIRMIDLVHPTQEPLTGESSFLLSAMAIMFAVGQPLVNAASGFFMPEGIGGMSHITIVLVTIGFLLLVVVGGVVGYARGQFRFRYDIYPEGVMIQRQGMNAFTRWEEVKSVERLKQGKYRIRYISEKARPMNIRVKMDKSMEFEYMLSRMGKLAEG